MDAETLADDDKVQDVSQTGELPAAKPSAGKVLYYLICFFCAYAVIGWIWETIYTSLDNGRYMQRGFLNGPYCPVYGFGIILVLYLIRPFFNDRISVLFLLSALAVTALEYFTGMLLENVFHLKLWDYSRFSFNIQGRIALPVSIFWGIGCVILVKLVQPRLHKLVDYLYSRVGVIVPILIVLVMLVDLALALTVKHRIISL